MDIYFIRHGDPDYSTDSLTEIGHEQAKKLAQAIESWKPDGVFQSTMGRAKQTAEYSAAKWGIEPVSCEWLRELCWGDMKGDAYASESPWTVNNAFIREDHKYPVGDAWKNHPKVKNDRIVQDLDLRYKAFDSFLAEQGYVREGQLYNAITPNNRKLVFFCHGGISCALMAYVMNIPFNQFIAHAAINVTSISKIHFSDRAGYACAQLAGFNDCRHLES